MTDRPGGVEQAAVPLRTSDRAALSADPRYRTARQARRALRSLPGRNHDVLPLACPLDREPKFLADRGLVDGLREFLPVRDRMTVQHDDPVAHPQAGRGRRAAHGHTR